HGVSAVHLWCGAQRTESLLHDHVPRAPGRNYAGQGNSARSARVATAGSLARHTAATTASPAAPARASDPAVATSMPPMAMTGTPAGASPARAANPAAPSGGPASGLVSVAKQGPTLQ